jgi:hypothetical protein
VRPVPPHLNRNLNNRNLNNRNLNNCNLNNRNLNRLFFSRRPFNRNRNPIRFHNRIPIPNRSCSTCNHNFSHCRHHRPAISR